MSEGEFSCVMKPQRKYKLRSKMVVVPFDGWGIELFPGRRLFPNPFFVETVFRWSRFGFGCSVMDAIGASRAAGAASRAGYVVFRFRMVRHHGFTRGNIGKRGGA